MHGTLNNSHTKNTKMKTDREKRLSMALRENLRKRKSQNVEREKSKEILEKDTPQTPTEC